MKPVHKDELAPLEPSEAPTTVNASQSAAPMVSPANQVPMPASSTSSAEPSPLASAPVLTQPSMDWIDLNALRVGRDFRRRTSTKTLLPTIPLYRPRFGESFIVRPGFEWTVRTWGVETEEDGEFYLVVLPDLWSQLRPVLQNVDLFTVMNQRGVVALWPVNLSSTGPSSQLLPNAMAVATASISFSYWPAVLANRPSWPRSFRSPLHAPATARRSKRGCNSGSSRPGQIPATLCG